MTTEQDPSAAAEAKAEVPEERRSKAKEMVREGFVVAVAAVFRAGDAIASATSGSREVVRSVLSEARPHARRIAESASELTRRIAAAARAPRREGNRREPEKPAPGEAREGSEA